jgi:hypothetical protein
MSASASPDDEWAGSIDCDQCRDLLTTEFLADALIAADRRKLDPADVVTFALWWFHDAGHPFGHWHPTGSPDIPMFHET